MLKVYEYGYKRHQFLIQSLKDLLFSRIFRPDEELNQINCENSHLKKRWSTVSISFSQRGQDWSIVLINLERFPFTATTLCRHLQMNITTCGGMLLNFHNVLNILPEIISISIEDGAFPLLNWVYVDLVVKFPEGVRVDIRLSFSYLSTWLRWIFHMNFDTWGGKRSVKMSIPQLRDEWSTTLFFVDPVMFLGTLWDETPAI